MSAAKSGSGLSAALVDLHKTKRPAGPASRKPGADFIDPPNPDVASLIRASALKSLRNFAHWRFFPPVFPPRNEPVRPASVPLVSPCSDGLPVPPFCVLGHLPVFPEGEWCACGQRGCTETYASAAALSRRYAAASGISDVRAEDVIGRAAAGDPIAEKIFNDAITALGRALVNYVLIMDPELILIGGGMGASGAALLDPLMQAVQGGLAWRAAPAILNGTLAGDAGRRGAGLLAWHALSEHD